MLTCNIDARGRAVRLVGGIVTALVGVAFLVVAVLDLLGSAWPWIPAVACLLAGAFQIFEARAGWCALRALGVKTPL